MSKKTEHSFSSVISVNPYKETYQSSISNFLSQPKKPEFKKEQFAISFLNTKSFINTQIGISKNILDEDLYDAITNKVYDELALDQAVLYQIQYVEIFSTIDEDNRNFNVFILDPLTLDETFADVTKKIKYIDTIIPSPLLFKSLYEKELIESAGSHCFVYFQENDAFIAIYNEKEFIYSKSINYSFIQIHERFCEIYGERVEYAKFLEFLSTQSLKDTESDFKEPFIRLYKEIFANVNDILTYAKRAFELEKIEQVFIASQFSIFTKLDEMSEVELDIKSTNLEFDYGLENDGTYVEQLHYLLQIYNTLPEDQRYECNFTIYHRPPKFIKRDSGKLIITVAASFILAFLYPGVYWSLTYALSIQHSLKSTEYAELHNVRTTREATIKNRKADRDAVQKLLNIQKADYDEKKKTLIKIHDVKVNYPMKAKLIANFSKDINKYGMNIESLSYAEDDSDKSLTLNLVSSKEKLVTKMLEYMTKKYDKKYDFTLLKIHYDEETKKYFSALKVSILKVSKS